MTLKFNFSLGTIHKSSDFLKITFSVWPISGFLNFHIFPLGISINPFSLFIAEI